MQRSLTVLVAVLVSGCALHHARLETTSTVTMTRQSDGLCGPIGIRRASLGARWGEYVRVSVTAPTPVSGEARLHVDGRASPLQRFDTSPSTIPVLQLATTTELPAVVPAISQQQVVVLDMGWTNERLDVPAAIEAGHVIDITVSDVRAASGSCAGVVFTVEQGVFQPNVDERQWVAELTRRGGPELQAWFAAEAARKEQIRLEHYALAEQRKAEWAIQLEARRAEVAAAIELERRQEAARVEVAVELARKQDAERVEQARVEAAHREEVRQAHYAEYERRKAAKLEVNVQAVAVAQAPAVQVATPAPVVAQQTVVAAHETSVHVSAVAIANGGATVSGGSVGGSTLTESGVASGTINGGSTWTESGSVASGTINAGSTSAESGAVVTAGTISGGGGVAVGTINGGSATDSTVAVTGSLQAQPVSREDVVATNAAQEWSTPSFSRVTVSTESVAPCAPPPAPPMPQPVTVQVVEHRPDPGVVAAVHLLGAIFGVVANAPPPPQPVHPARLIQQPLPPPAPAPAPQPPPPPPAR